MRLLVKSIFIATMVMSVSAARAQTSEAPPREPPYVDDNEFDPVQGEDPAASDSAIPVAPAQEPQSPPRVSQPSRPSYSTGSRTKAYKPGTTPEKGVKLLHHPDVKKGLLRIEQDGTYVYKVKTQKSKQSGILRLGMMEPPRIEAADGIHNFSTMYGNEGMFTVMGEYEWHPLSGFGKLGIQAGVGFAMAEGKGYFENDTATRPEESYTFFAVPVTLGAIYRLEYFKRQWLAPYVSGGVSYIGVAELRDDDEKHFSGTPAAYGAGGVMFNISALDRNLSFALSNEYDIANLWIIGEYRYQQAFSEDLDFSGGIMTVGVGADF